MLRHMNVLLHTLTTHTRPSYEHAGSSRWTQLLPQNPQNLLQAALADSAVPSTMAVAMSVTAIRIQLTASSLGLIFHGSFENSRRPLARERQITGDKGNVGTRNRPDYHSRPRTQVGYSSLDSPDMSRRRSTCYDTPTCSGMTSLDICRRPYMQDRFAACNCRRRSRRTSGRRHSQVGQSRAQRQ
jgi:hypothetical protein